MFGPAYFGGGYWGPGYWGSFGGGEPSEPEPRGFIITADHLYVAFSPRASGEILAVISESYRFESSSDLQYRIKLLRSQFDGENTTSDPPEPQLPPVLKSGWTNPETVATNARYGAIAVDIINGTEIFAYQTMSGAIYVKRRKFGESDWTTPVLIVVTGEPRPMSLELAMDKGRLLVIVYEIEGVIWRQESRDYGDHWSPARRITPTDVGVACSYPSLAIFPGDNVEWIAVYEEDNVRWALYRSHSTHRFWVENDTPPDFGYWEYHSVICSPNEQPSFERVAYIVADETSNSGTIEWIEEPADRLVWIGWDTINQRIGRLTSDSGGVLWQKEAFKVG